MAVQQVIDLIIWKTKMMTLRNYHDMQYEIANNSNKEDHSITIKPVES